MFELALAGFLAALLGLGLRRPFVWVLAYIYVDIVAPQKISWLLLKAVPVSLIVFIAAFGGWLVLDRKDGTRFSLRQGLMLALLVYCGMTTVTADFPDSAWDKWDWVWKALVFAIFLPLTLRTRLRIEATALVMVLSAGALIISAGIKTIISGGGYGTLKSFVSDNTGLYEGSTLSMAAIAMIPLIVWVARHGTIYRPDWRVKLFALALGFACVLVPIGTQTRTGLLCMGLLAILSLRSVKRRFLYLTLMGGLAFAAIPFLPQSYTKRMSTIENHEADESASTRIAVWKWTLDYASHNPFGGGFDAYRGNTVSYEKKDAETSGSSTAIETKEVNDAGRAYHSAYFEMLGEQGYPGLALWLWLQLSGLWQMEMVRRRYRKRTGPGEQWQAPLANALQQGQVIYMVGAVFVGIAFQPFIYMLIALQIALTQQVRRTEQAARPPRVAAGKPRLKPIVAGSQS